MLPTLDIIVVNWNTGRHLDACLRSIAAADRSGFALARVVVVDNASSDSSDEVSPAGGLPLTVLRNRENVGFAAACNQGAADSSADYLLFLNPDTELNAASLSRPAAFMESRSAGRVGICGIRLEDASGRPAIAGARFPSPGGIFAAALGLPRLFPSRFPSRLIRLDEGDRDREVDQVVGAFFMIRRSLFARLGGFDERFFVYFEEVDLSLRVSRLGFASVVLAGASARHEGGVSSSRATRARLFYSLRSRMLYASKHFGAGGRRAVAAATACELVVRVVHAAARLSWRDAADAVAASARLLAWACRPARATAGANPTRGNAR